jgi:two-component system, OmpR family, sensor histidine kinase MprB
MPLRRRLGLAAAVAVAVAVAIAALISYLVVRAQLRGEVNGELRAQAASILRGQPHSMDEPLPGLPASSGGPAPYVQLVLASGQSYHRQGDLTLPAGTRAAAVAAGTADAYMRDLNVSGSHLRQYVFPLPGAMLAGESVAVELARPLNGVDRVLSHLRLILLVLFAGDIALAVALGRLAAGRVLSPLAEVAQAAERIGATDDLSLRLRIRADDEIGQLATRFNHMLERLQSSRAALDDSVRAQRQLVADASHELRTPVTSLRTNIEVLLAGGELEPDDRRRLLGDVVDQSEELSQLVGDLIELARGDLSADRAEDVRLDRVLEESLQRARRNSPGVDFTATLSPVTLEGVPERLGRAVNNLLDNAARHSPPGGRVEVVLDDRGLLVRDHGTGIDPDDLPYVFDRFFRGAGARAQQGSGLGLAIVRQVTEQHGGTVHADNAPDGGAVFTLRLPVSATRAGDDPRLAGPPEAPAEQPEQTGEYRDDDEQDGRSLAGLAEDGDHERAAGHRRDPGEQ